MHCRKGARCQGGTDGDGSPGGEGTAQWEIFGPSVNGERSRRQGYAESGGGGVSGSNQIQCLKAESDNEHKNMVCACVCVCVCVSIVVGPWGDGNKGERMHSILCWQNVQSIIIR